MTRVWTWHKGTHAGGVIKLTEGGEIRMWLGIAEADLPEAQFITDALNEKEQRDAEEQPLTAEERAAITAQGYAELGEGVTFHYFGQRE